MSTVNLLRSLKPLPPQTTDEREVINLSQAQLKWSLVAAVEKHFKLRAPKLNDSELAKRQAIWQAPELTRTTATPKLNLQRGPNRVDLAFALQKLADQQEKPSALPSKGQAIPATEAAVFRSRKRDTQTPLQALFSKLDQDEND